MADNECWITVELTATGDADMVIETICNETKWSFQGRKQGGAVVLHGDTFSFEDVKEPLETVADHLARLVFVGSVEGGRGETLSKYFSDTDNLDEPTDELTTIPGRWWIGEHFDYYTTKYGVYAAV